MTTNTEKKNSDKTVDEMLVCREQEIKIYRKELVEKEKELLKVQNELKMIRESHGQKILQKCYNMRETLFPFGSKRRLIGSLLLKTMSNPQDIFSKLNKTNLNKFFYYWKTESPGELLGRIDRYTHNTAIEPLALILNELPTINGEKSYPLLYIPQNDTIDVSIIIPVYNQFSYTYLCLKSILNDVSDIKYEIIIADDCSTDETKDIADIVRNVHVIHNKQNLRFLKNCNNAAQYAKGKYILFLNNDTQVQPGWLESLVRLIEQDKTIGMVGSMFVYPDGRLQEAGGIVWKDASAWNYGHGDDPMKPEYNYVKEVDYISGASIMIRADLWREIGGFDESFAPAYYEDSDLAFAVRQHGYKVMYQPKSIVVHFEGISNGTDVTSGQKAYQITNREKFRTKWQNELEEKHFNNAEHVFLARDRSLDKKCVLVIDQYVPEFDRDAGSRTVYQYLKLLVNQGYNVKFLSDNFYKSEPYTDDLEMLGIEVLYGRSYRNNWKTWILNNKQDIDVVISNRPHITIHYIDFLKQNTSIKIIYYGHDLHCLREKREYAITKDKALLQSSEKWEKQELDIMRKAAYSYYPSSVECKLIRTLDSNIKVGVLSAYVFKEKQPKVQMIGRKGLLFIGGFNHRPNVDAVLWFYDAVLPLILKSRKDIVVNIVGSSVPEKVKSLGNDNFVIRGRVSDEELTQLYAQCKIDIVPLRYGAGIKGKVIEGMHFGIPIVTTSVGAEGIEDAKSCFQVADSADEFADAILKLYDDEDRLYDMAVNSIEYVNHTYSETTALKVIDQIMEEENVQ